MPFLSRASARILRRAAHPPSIARNSSRSRHTVAIARDIPDSFVDAVVAHHHHHHHHSSADRNDDDANATDVSLDVAREQHRDYVSQLRRHVPTICLLPAIESHPDCLFVEDAVVAIGDTAVVTRMGHASRRGEVDSVKEALRRLGVAEVHDMRGNEEGENEDGNDDGNNDDDDAERRPRCDGGDVMYTGRHLFVGMSGRTNARGFEYLRDAFSNSTAGTTMLRADDVVSVPSAGVAGKEALHLKSVVTHLDERTLLAPEGPVGDAALAAMGAVERGYVAIRLPDVLSCNAVVVNDHVLAQDAPCEVSRGRIVAACEERGLGLTFVDTSELAKKDAALTCCSVLLCV